MATQRQIAANRRNAQRSTGPKTEAGKAASRNNALRHGLTSEDVVIPGEVKSDFDQLTGDLLAEHQPATPTEAFQVEQMAMAMWRLRRLRKTETAHIEMELERHESTVDSEFDNNGPWNHVAYTFRYDAVNSNTLVNLSRYEVRLERSYYKALRELQRLKAERAPAPATQTKQDAAGQIGFVSQNPRTAPPRPAVPGSEAPLMPVCDHPARPRDGDVVQT